MTFVTATLIVAWLTAIFPGYPQWWGPLPLTVIIPYFITENPMLALVPIAAVGVLLAIPVMNGSTSMPWATAIPIAVLIVLSWWYFASGISYGLQYQSGIYVVVCGAMQGAFTISLVGLWVGNRRRHSYSLVLIWHLLAAVWLASYAFPYYGELP